MYAKVYGQDWIVAGQIGGLTDRYLGSGVGVGGPVAALFLALEGVSFFRYSGSSKDRIVENNYVL
jgi:hypothetical protein